MDTCPQCHRKLLSHASARCNWCGAEIQDAAYLAQAQTEREAYFAAQSARDAITLANMQNINTNAYNPLFDPLINSPILGNSSPLGWRGRAADLAERRVQRDALEMERMAAIEQAKAQAVPVAATPPTPPQAAEAEPAAENAEESRFRHLEL